MNRHALITGASRGIGRATAGKFAEAGYDLTITCRSNTSMLSELADGLRDRFGITCDIFTGDLSDPENVRALFKDIKDIDVLVNNAGISHHGLLQDMTCEEWRSVIGCNLDSAFYCCRSAIPLMLKKKSGRIINISSVWGEHGASMEAAYSASKGGLNALTKALARELGPSGIRVNAIACGLIDTEMNAIYNKEEILSIIEDIPEDRIGQPEDVAELALMLASCNDYLTGQIITLDGGWT
ncbi:MAG: 3-oxoacyl-ACP reductase FabG [Lachnospiraceae bacterium]|nr:3-oxoacyl-ACP reductase FabG [Lachnospiraceae bacterium]